MIRTLLLNDNNMYIDVEIDQIPKRSFYTTVTENLSYDYDSYEKEYIGILRKISLNTNSNMEDLIQFVTKKKKGRLFINDNIYISSPIKIKSESIPNYNFGEIIRIPTNTISKVNISKVNLAGFPPEKDSYDIISNSQNDVFVSYLLNNYIIKFSQNGLPKVFVGKVFESGYKDGDGENALFNKPAGMAIDANDNIYVADTGNNAIRKITPDGTVSTFYKEL
jgi:hypothetical protein